MTHREGFWYSKHEPDLPMPQTDLNWDKAKFLKVLTAYEDSIVEPYLAACLKYNKDHEEACKLAEAKGERRPRYDNFPEELRVQSYRGSSTCRMCGQLNGSREFIVGDWEWPSGYRHYIGAHSVKPSDEFQAFILSQVS